MADVRHGQPSASAIDPEERFGFGRNWRDFLRVLDPERIAIAEQSMRNLLGVEDLRGRRFLDIGSGSGLFSLCAYRLGADVTSFDYDPDSVACTQSLRDRFAEDVQRWRLLRGSVLDAGFVQSLGTFDIVYSWGVLHHTGHMWTALDHACRAVGQNGLFAIAIYNDQGWKSRWWWRVKKTYCANALGRAAVLGAFIPAFAGACATKDLIHFRPVRRRYKDYRTERGMSLWHDWIDWLGGFPFEVATPERVIEVCAKHGFEVRQVARTRTWGNNEFLFQRLSGERDVIMGIAKKDHA